MKISIITALATTSSIVGILMFSSCNKKQSHDEARDSTRPDSIPINQPKISEDTKTVLRSIYEDAPAHRAATNAAVSGSGNPVIIDNNTEAPKLEDVFKRLGWGTVTITEGVKIASDISILWRLEVIDSNADDWFVELETDESITAGEVKVKSKDSPWNQ